ncbi:hypothetical protein [Clostridioides sp. ES-S-0006-03]
MKKIILAGINDKLKEAYKLQLEEVLGEIAEIETNYMICLVDIH